MKDPNQILECVQYLIDQYLSKEQEEALSEQMILPGTDGPSAEPAPGLGLASYEMSKTGDFVLHSLKLERPGLHGEVLRVSLTEYVGKKA